MAKEILFQAQQESIPASSFVLAIVLGVAGTFVMSPLGGFVLLLVSIAYSYLSTWRKYRQTLANPIRLDFEGVHYNVITKELGGDCLPWEAVSKVSEIVRANGKRKVVRIDLAPGLYYENWRELKIGNRMLDPGYVIDANLYDTDHEGMLYQFKTFHKQYGLANVNYDASKEVMEEDDSLKENSADEPSNIRLVVSALFGYLIIIYSELSGRFPLGRNGSLSADTSPLLYWIMVVSFFLIASWAASTVYVRHNSHKAEDDANKSAVSLSTKGLFIAGLICTLGIYLLEFVFGLALTNYYLNSGNSVEEAVELLSNTDLFVGVGIILLFGILLFSGTAGLVLSYYRADTNKSDCVFLLALCCGYWMIMYLPADDYLDSISNILIRIIPIVVGYFGGTFLLERRTLTTPE